MGCPANIREQVNFWSFAKQADIATQIADSGLWRMKKLNPELLNPVLLVEDDATEYGKGHEFPTETFKTSWDAGLPQIDKYLSSDFAAWAMVFGLGHTVKTGTTPNFIYTCTPLDLVTDCLELPYYSFGQAIRQGGSSVMDEIAIGCAIEGWTFTLGTGPGRANSKLVVEQHGSGKFARPSGATIPSAFAEKLLPAASCAITINGIDYVSAKTPISLEASWKNNLRLNMGYFPGSGSANGGAIRGRLFVGDRVLGLKFSVFFENGSDELTKLTAQTSGTAIVTVTFDTNNSLQLTYEKLVFKTAVRNNTEGIVNVEVDCTPLYDPTNGLISVVAKCNTDGIGEVAA